MCVYYAFCIHTKALVQLPDKATSKCSFYPAAECSLCFFYLFFIFCGSQRRWGICCSAWLLIDMYCLGQVRVAEWLPSWPCFDRAVSTWRWPSPWILHSAQLACQVLKASWSIKHLNDDHSLMHSPNRPLPLLLHITVYILNDEWMGVCVWVYFFSVPPALHNGV